MALSLCSYALKSSLNPEISNALQPLIDLLKEEWEMWAVKPQSKTIVTIEKCKWALLLLQHFVFHDNWKAAYLSMQKNDFQVSDLKACFRGSVEKQQRALKLYKGAMLQVISWIDGMIPPDENK